MGNCCCFIWSVSSFCDKSILFLPTKLDKCVACKSQVDDRLKELEGVITFTDFVQAFSQFGSDMVELAHLSGDRQNVSTS